MVEDKESDDDVDLDAVEDLWPEEDLAIGMHPEHLERVVDPGADAVVHPEQVVDPGADTFQTFIKYADLFGDCLRFSDRPPTLREVANLLHTSARWTLAERLRALMTTGQARPLLWSAFLRAERAESRRLEHEARKRLRLEGIALDNHAREARRRRGHQLLPIASAGNCKGKSKGIAQVFHSDARSSREPAPEGESVDNGARSSHEPAPGSSKGKGKSQGKASGKAIAKHLPKKPDDSEKKQDKKDSEKKPDKKP